MKGEDLSILLSGYLDGELTPSEREEVLALLASSPEARAEFEALREEKARLEKDLRKTRTAFDQLKMQCAMVEEKKSETELSLKTEIKFLISIFCRQQNYSI